MYRGVAEREPLKKVLKYGDPVFARVRAESFPTYYPPITAPYPLVEAALQIGGKGLIAVFGYGSAFTNEQNRSSKMDLIFIVEDPRAFHERNIRAANGIFYGRPRSVALHTKLNEWGLNYYRGQLNLEGQKKEAKIVVIGYEDFISHASWGNKQGIVTWDSFRYAYAGARMTKGRIVEVYRSTDSDKRKAMQEQINLAINQDRINYFHITLARLPTYFSERTALEEYLYETYLEDIRIEKGRKHLDILKQTEQDCLNMFSALVEQFVAAGILSREGDQLVKLMSLSEESVRARIIGTKAVYLVTNYGKNWATFGLLEGPEYCLDKVARTIDSSLQESMSSLFVGMSEKERKRLIKGVLIGTAVTIAMAAIVRSAVARQKIVT